MFKKYQQIHFVGIGGIGMSGIARVLINLGYRVTGSDLKVSDATKDLSRLGAKIFRGHAKKNVTGAHVVVTSSAVSRENPEVREALNQGIAVVPRAEMLAELMRLKYSVAVAGTHGKTSTTSLIGCIFDHAGFDPTLIIGGRVNNLRSNARLGKGDFLIAEADESDRSFLKLNPTIAVITNIDPEHMENYHGFEDLKRAFVDFANKVPFYGAVVACKDHPVVRNILPLITRPVVTYGLKDADYAVKDVKQSAARLAFNVVHKGKSLGAIHLNMVGAHYAQNAVAAIAVCRYLDIPFWAIKEALSKFDGVGRRFEILSMAGPIVVDDYGHHPVEIEATLAAAKTGWPKKRLIAVVQPHRYSRLAGHFGEFVDVIGRADLAIVMDVYPAGEPPHRIYTGEKLWREICGKYPKKTVKYAPKTEDVMALLPNLCRRQDMILFLGAGSITKTAREFAKTLI